MTSDLAFEQQLLLIAEWMSATRAASSLENREAGLKTACEQAVLALDRDLQAISELEDRLARHEPRRDAGDEQR